MPLKITLIDDEPMARHTLKKMLHTYCPQVSVVGEASGVVEGVALLRQTPTDLLMLDIEMEDGTGFDLLEQAKPLPCQLVFVTAHDEFAVRAFRCNAIDYLLKPINPQDLVAAVEKAHRGVAYDTIHQRIETLLDTVTQMQTDRLTLHTSKGLLFISMAEIVCVESYGNYTFVYFNSGERHLDMRNLKEYEEILPPSAFARTHQSFIVRIAAVRQWLRGEENALVLSTGMRVPVSRRRRDELQRLLAP